MKPPIVLWGAGGHGRVVAEAIGLAGVHELVGWIDDSEQARPGAHVDGLPVFGGRESLERLRQEGIQWLCVAVGQGKARSQIGHLAEAGGFRLATVIHPRAIVSRSAEIGPGAFVAAGAIIAPDVRLGPYVIVNHGASIDHDCVVGLAAHVCPGARLAGNVRVGEHAWIGLGAVVIERMSVGDGAVIGAGSVVIGDVPAGVVAVGNPARPVRPKPSPTGDVAPSR